jgi:mono/diheme cytochrome c family protein
MTVRREVTDLMGSGLLLAALIIATVGALAPTSGASASLTSATVAAAAPDVERGRMLFHVKGCITCHRKAGEPRGNIGDVGPDLTGLAQRAADRRAGVTAVAYVRESLRTPSAFLVPGYNERMPDLGLGDDEISALTAFLLGTP